MKASFIIPIYNTGKDIHNCVKSILEQTLSCYEIILVNDGSTDESIDICNQYSQNSKVKVFHQDNKGVSGARNAGMKLATGDYICFVDADDMINSNYLEEVYSIINEASVDVIQIGYERVSYSQHYRYQPFKRKIYSNIDSFYTNEKVTHAVWSYIFKRSLISERSLEFTLGLKYSEDQEFILKYLHFAKTIAVINKTLYNYIDRDLSAVNVPLSFDRALCQLRAAYGILKNLNETSHQLSKLHVSEIKRLVDDYFIYASATNGLSNNKILNEYILFYQSILAFNSSKHLKVDLFNPIILKGGYCTIARVKNKLRRIRHKLLIIINNI